MQKVLSAKFSFVCKLKDFRSNVSFNKRMETITKKKLLERLIFSKSLSNLELFSQNKNYY